MDDLYDKIVTRMCFFMEFKLKRFEKVIEVTKIANIHYFEFTNQYHTKKDMHEFRELVYVDSGRIYTEAENYSGILETNQIIIHRPFERHSLTCPDGIAPNVIIIGFECSSPELDIFSDSPTALTIELQKSLTDIIREGRTVFLPPYDIPNLKDMKKRKNYPFGADQMIKLLMEEFFIKLIRSKNTSDITESPSVTDMKIYDVYNYILKNFKEPISLDELCFLFNTNKTTLCGSFKKSYGETIIKFINRLKIKEAKKLMREENLNLTEISVKLGFNSIHYFSRMFKEYEHQSPSSYINTIKAKLEV